MSKKILSDAIDELEDNITSLKAKKFIIEEKIVNLKKDKFTLEHNIKKLEISMGGGDIALKDNLIEQNKNIEEKINELRFKLRKFNVKLNEAEDLDAELNSR